MTPEPHRHQEDCDPNQLKKYSTNSNIKPDLTFSSCSSLTGSKQVTQELQDSREVPILKLTEILFFNIQSIRNKMDLLESLLLKNKIFFSVLCISEHWLLKQECESLIISQYNLSSYFARTYGYGGSLILTHNSLICNNIPEVTNLSQEKVCEMSAVFIPALNLTVLSIYRSPSGKHSDFLIILNQVLDLLYDNRKSLLIGGDFNSSFTVPNEDTRNLTNLLLSHGLRPHVNFPTRLGNGLDNIFTNLDMSLVRVTNLNTGISDHSALSLQIKTETNLLNKSKVVF